MNKLTFRSLLVFLVFTPQTGLCGEVILQPDDLPDRIVELVNTSSNHLLVNFVEAGSTESAKNFTRELKVESTTKYKTKTGPLKPNGSFKLERTLVESNKFSVEPDGTRAKLQDGKEKLVGVTMIGKADLKGNIRIEELFGGKLSNVERKQYLDVIEQIPIIEPEPTPETSLSVGDSFTVPSSTKIPYLEGKAIEFHMAANYTLKSIENGIAYFEITMEFDFADDLNTKMVGNASGFMQYNLNLQLEENEFLNWTIDVTEEADEGLYRIMMSNETTSTQAIMDE